MNYYLKFASILRIMRENLFFFLMFFMFFLIFSFKIPSLGVTSNTSRDQNKTARALCIMEYTKHNRELIVWSSQSAQFFSYFSFTLNSHFLCSNYTLSSYIYMTKETYVRENQHKCSISEATIASVNIL